jgi:uncharacterized protein YndB with AHSA1/START domain
MTLQSTSHSTVVLSRTFAAPRSRLYEAFSAPAERLRMCAADGPMLLIPEATDFRIGGHEVLRFGSRGNPRFLVHSIYHDIVPECRIVTSDVVSAEEARLAIALTTIEFIPSMMSTQFKITAQLVALHDSDLLDEAGGRYQAMIDNLGLYLGSPEPGPLPRRGRGRTLFPR